MLIARFPYIIVLTVDLAGPADSIKAREPPILITLQILLSLAIYREILEDITKSSFIIY